MINKVDHAFFIMNLTIRIMNSRPTRPEQCIAVLLRTGLTNFWECTAHAKV